MILLVAPLKRIDHYQEIRDGQVFEVAVLPDVKPPRGRSMKTRFHLPPGDVGKGPPKKKRRRRSKSARQGLGQ